MHVSKRFWLTVALGLGAGLAFAQDLSRVQVRSEHVAGKVHILTGAGGNIGVSAGEDGILMIDDQFAPLAGKIKEELGKLKAGELKWVLNTHFHQDHTDGNKVFGREAPIVAHENVRERVKRALPKEGWPVLTFEQSVSIHFNGEEIKVIHYPKGHTDGDSVIFFTESNVVHMGDHFFNGMFPFVDLDGGGDVEGYIANVEAVLKELPRGAKIIPGHGPLAEKKDLEGFHKMLTETVEHVRKGIDRRKSLDELKKGGLPKKWDSWSWSFVNTERWIETIHRSLTR